MKITNANVNLHFPNLFIFDIQFILIITAKFEFYISMNG